MTFTQEKKEEAWSLKIFSGKKRRRRNHHDQSGRCAQRLKAEIREDIAAALQLAENDVEVRVVIITGAGEKVFSAGGDIKQMAENTMWDILGRKFDLFSQIHNFPKPIIAAINGLAWVEGASWPWLVIFG